MTTISYAYESPSMDWEADAGPSYETLEAFPPGEQSRPLAHVNATEGTPTWLPQVIDSANEILRLEDGWAGPGSVAPTAQVVLRALEALNELAVRSLLRPQLLPTVDGGVQFEWHVRGLDVELSFLPWGESDVYIYHQESGEEQAGDLSEHSQIVRMVVRQLAE